MRGAARRERKFAACPSRMLCKQSALRRRFLVALGVNHGRGIARLRGGQIFIGVQGEVIGAKGVAQSPFLNGQDALQFSFGKTMAYASLLICQNRWEISASL